MGLFVSVRVSGLGLQHVGHRDPEASCVYLWGLKSARLGLGNDDLD